MTKTAEMAALPPLTTTIDALMMEHGRIRVVAATFAGLLRAGLIQRDLAEMPDHLRRDIGLEPRNAPPRRGERVL